MPITDKKYFSEFYRLIGKDIPKFIANYDFSEANGDFGYTTLVSAVYSSNIEGNSIDLNSFMNYKLSKEKFRQPPVGYKPTKEIEEIENLIAAYEFAQNNILNETDLLECHKIFSKTLLIKSKRGKYRMEKVGVFSQAGMVYTAIEPEHIQKIMKTFFKNLKILINQNLSTEETFYFASLIHLKFAHIHPFSDGNGRAARLLEKWFLTEKLGKDLWKIPSERYYKENQAKYYEHINLGVNYYELDYDKCVPFLLMLPKCLKNIDKDINY